MNTDELKDKSEKLRDKNRKWNSKRIGSWTLILKSGVKANDTQQLLSMSELWFISYITSASFSLVWLTAF